MKAISRCRICEKESLMPFFDLGCQPFANALVRDPDGKEERYPLALSWCSNCHLVQLNHTADPEALFSNYVWVTSTSSTACDYAERFCETVLKRTGKASRDSYVLELASNDGTFLKPFIRQGCQVCGVDPAENIVQMACEAGIPTSCGFFSEKMAETILSESGHPDVIIARNVLPHVADPIDFIKGMKRCMTPDSLLVIEVHYAKPILDQLHYDSIYHEHLCYFSLESLSYLLGRFELSICDIIESPISGGSVVVFVRKGAEQKSEAVTAYEAREQAEGVNTFDRWREFARAAQTHREQLLALLDEQRTAGQRMVGYGASARSSTMLNFCGIGTNYLEWIADQNPMKHHLYSPGTHIPIESPETVMGAHPDTVVMLAWNFAEEIMELLRKRFNFRQTVILPLPHPPTRLLLNEETHD